MRILVDAQMDQLTVSLMTVFACAADPNILLRIQMYNNGYGLHLHTAVESTKSRQCTRKQLSVLLDFEAFGEYRFDVLANPSFGCCGKNVFRQT